MVEQIKVSSSRGLSGVGACAFSARSSPLLPLLLRFLTSLSFRFSLPVPFLPVPILPVHFERERNHRGGGRAFSFGRDRKDKSVVDGYNSERPLSRSGGAVFHPGISFEMGATTGPERPRSILFDVEEPPPPSPLEREFPPLFTAGNRRAGSSIPLECIHPISMERTKRSACTHDRFSAIRTIRFAVIPPPP